MLYKVTPMLPGPEAKPKRVREPGQPRKKRKSAIYDHEGNEVLITLMCLKCRSIKPLAQFGLRKMADGAIRNQPWCRGCRSGAGTPKAKVPAEKAELAEVVLTASEQVSVAGAPAALAEEEAPALEAQDLESTDAPPPAVEPVAMVADAAFEPMPSTSDSAEAPPAPSPEDAVVTAG